MPKGLSLTAVAVIAATAPALAQNASISQERPSFQFSINGTTVAIPRSGQGCPTSCIQPMQAAPGVATIGELEILDFLELFVSRSQGLLIDARLPARYGAGTIPGAVNVPSATLRADNPYRDDLLTALGVRNGDFSAAFDLVLFGAGQDTAEAAEALRSLVQAGYPTSKLKYYRGGLRSWSAMGLGTATGQ
ncbi:MAG: rhodanese-like domain-containing protein [Pelagimonas sp.]|jgi:rhodanese-related sulfurtransferase|nr:rhodanese-like domain-containing protein [Pelagimonas sp.]